MRIKNSYDIERIIATERQNRTGNLEINGSDVEEGASLYSIPDFVFELTHLKSLKLPSHRISEIPNRISQLKNLKVIDLSENPIQTITGNISKLSKLQEFQIRNSSLKDIPKFLFTHPPIRRLSFSLARPSYVDWSTRPIGQLNPDIEQISLPRCDLTDIPEWFLIFENLMSLDVQDNRLVCWPKNLARLTSLRSLNLSDNSIGCVDENIGQLTELQFLGLYRTGIDSLPRTIRYLEKLENLTLWNNKFESIPEVIYELTSLKVLSFTNNSTSGTRDNNNIRAISPDILQLTNLKTLDLTANPIETPPPEIVTRGVEAIKEYFSQLDHSGVDYLYEAKLIIVGEGGAGKTTLSNKLRDHQYELNPDEKSTQGIDIKKWNVLCNDIGHRVSVNIWDFGGQEIYHATHQYFLTKRSLYILVTDDRKEDTDFFYWLNVIELLSGSSPVIIVKNEKQDRHREINETFLRSRFTNIVNIIPANLATGRGMSQVVSEVARYIGRLPHIGIPLPRAWVGVRRDLERRLEHYIRTDVYLDVCTAFGFDDDKSKISLSEYLHDIGVILHFHSDSVLRNIVILKPTWGTSAAYAVLDNEAVIRSYGRFTYNDLYSIWGNSEYKDMFNELLQLMLKFQLCYRIPNTDGEYLAPQLLNASPPDYPKETASLLIVSYTYEFLPKGIITRLIVALHALIYQGIVWRTGVLVDRNRTWAEVSEVPDQRKIIVTTWGSHKRDLFAIIDYEIERIHRSFHNLKHKVHVPCNCNACRGNVEGQAYEYDILQKFTEDGVAQIQCYKSYEMVSVQNLIDDVRPVYESIQESLPSAGIDIRIRRGANTEVISYVRSDAMTDLTGGRPKSAWANGLFYLFAFIVIITALGVVSNAFSPLSFGLILIGSIILVPIVGAFQLRMDNQLNEKNFLDLMVLTFKQLPFIRKFVKEK